MGALHRVWHRLPLVTWDRVTSGQRALILAPHPDDETLGCGGLIAESCRRGQFPIIVFLTDGTGSHPGSRRYPALKLRDLREAEARMAASRLGLPPDHLIFLRAPDGAAFAITAQRVADIALKAQCRLLCATWGHDAHCDHQAADRIARSAALLCGARHLAYPIWGWLADPDISMPILPPIIGFRLDIARHRVAKRLAIAAHASQYSDLIDDDPGGFRLPAALLDVFSQPYEVFLAA